MCLEIDLRDPHEKKKKGMKAKNDKRNGKFGRNDGVWQLERR